MNKVVIAYLPASSVLIILLSMFRHHEISLSLWSHEDYQLFREEQQLLDM